MTEWVELSRGDQKLYLYIAHLLRAEHPDVQPDWIMRIWCDDSNMTTYHTWYEPVTTFVAFDLYGTTIVKEFDLITPQSVEAWCNANIPTCVFPDLRLLDSE